MRTTMGVLLVALLGLLGAGCGATATRAGDAGECPDHPQCTQMGCRGPTGERQVQFAVPIAAPMADLPGSAVTGCRNGACVTGTLLTPEESPYQCNCVEFPADEVYLKAYVRDLGDAGSPVLMAGWGSNFNMPGSLPEIRDGDRFSVEMRTPVGAVVAAASGVATYELVYPNGPCCPPFTPCVYSTLTPPPDGGTVH